MKRKDNESKRHNSSAPTHRKIVAGAAAATLSLLAACGPDNGGSKEKGSTTVTTTIQEGPATTVYEAPITTEMASTTTTISPAEKARLEKAEAAEAQSKGIEAVALQIADSAFARVDELYAANQDLDGTGIGYTYKEFIPGVQEGSLELRFDDFDKDLLCSMNMQFTTTEDGKREPKLIQVHCSNFSDIVSDSEWGGSDSITSVGVILADRAGVSWTLYSYENADVGFDGKEYEKTVSASMLDPLSEEILTAEMDKARYIAAYLVNARP